MPLTVSTSRHAYAKGESLLQQQHEHGWQNTGAIATRGIEHCHALSHKGLCSDGILVLSEVAGLLDVKTRTEARCLDHGSLINGLVGKHERHVAIDADSGLFSTVDVGGEVRRNEVDTPNNLSADERTGFIEVLGIVFHIDIGGGVTVMDELAREGRVRLVNDHNRGLLQGLVIVNPRVEQRVAQRHDDKEHEHTLVPNHLFHLLSPDIEYVGHVFLEFTEYRHS